MIYLEIYFIIAFISAIVTTILICIEIKIEGIDNVWDWIIYNLFWIVHLIKAAVKFIINQIL